MAFQPYTDPNYFYQSGRDTVGQQLFDASGLVETTPGSLLFQYVIGDFAYPSLIPSPHVEMTLFDLDPATKTITLYRTIGRRTMTVRGMVRVYAVGGVNVVDWEAPFGIDLTYWAAQFDNDGDFLGNTKASTTRIDINETWLSNPLDPAGAVQVHLARGAASKLTRQQDSDIQWAEGAGLGIAITGQRHALTEVPLAFYTLSDADSDKVNEILGDPYEVPTGPSIVCLRAAANENTRLPKPFIAYVALDEYPVSHPAGKQVTKWDGSATEVVPPAIELLAPVLTYDDIDAAYPSYGAMDSMYGSYLERDRDYSLTGLAATA